MADVRFEVRSTFTHPPADVWRELVDWAGHAEWIPATRVEVPDEDPTAVGARFTAWSGYGPLTLEDRMEVVRCDWDEATASGSCEVRKLGPVLTGTASFTVEPHPKGAEVVWVEDVVVPKVPGFMAPVVGRAGAVGFRVAMGRLGKYMTRAAKAVA